MFQFKHDLAFLTRNQERISVYEAFLRQWQVLMSRSAKKTEKSANPEQAEPESTSKEADKPKNDDKDPKEKDWDFGMFSPTPPSGSKGKQEQGQGRPIGGGPEGPDNKLLLYGALGIFAILGSVAFFEMGYKEISWKDFVNK